MQRYWMVWLSGHFPAGRDKPRYKHPTYDSAATEALRLASLNPGLTFVVVEAVAQTTSTPVVQHTVGIKRLI